MAKIIGQLLYLIASYCVLFTNWRKCAFIYLFYCVIAFKTFKFWSRLKIKADHRRLAAVCNTFFQRTNFNFSQNVIAKILYVCIFSKR